MHMVETTAKLGRPRN